MTIARLGLVPVPHAVELTGSVYRMPRSGSISLPAQVVDRSRRSGARIREAAASMGCEWSVIAAWPGTTADVVLQLEDGSEEQAYELVVNEERIVITAGDVAGLGHGTSTLLQLIRHAGPVLPTVAIEDRPAIARRGLMVDISRDRVPTMETLYRLVDLMESWKLNELQLYTEHTFAYSKHSDVWTDASPMTPIEVQRLDAYCRERNVELVPNQNSLGHLHRWLRHPAYAPLAEVDRFETRAWWGHGPFSLNVTDPAALALVRSMYDELLPNFSSRTINVGLDETVDLGIGRSRAVAERDGVGSLYLGWLRSLWADLNTRGYDVQVWGDIVAERPELVGQLPEGVTVMEWGYEAGHPFEERVQRLETARVPFYVCVGTSSWRTLAGRTTNMLANVAEGADVAAKYGARGYLITDWGWYEASTWQPWSISYAGFLAGAAFSWDPQAARSVDFADALDRLVFCDERGRLGKAYLALGDVYREFQWRPIDSSAPFWIMQERLASTREGARVGRDELLAALSRVEAAEAISGEARPSTSEGRRCLSEFLLVVALMRHASWRGLAATEGFGASAHTERNELLRDIRQIAAEFQRVWLKRHRIGGLSATRDRLLALANDYLDSGQVPPTADTVGAVPRAFARGSSESPSEI